MKNYKWTLKFTNEELMRQKNPKAYIIGHVEKSCDIAKRPNDFSVLMDTETEPGTLIVNVMDMTHYNIGVLPDMLDEAM